MSTTISGTSGVTFPDSTSMQTGQQACKAWVNFNGTGTVAIRGSYNVSSVTDNGTGQYTVNFTTAMPDANFADAINSDFDGFWWTTSKTVNGGAIRIFTGSSYIDRSVITYTVFSN